MAVVASQMARNNAFVLSGAFAITKPCPIGSKKSPPIESHMYSQMNQAGEIGLDRDKPIANVINPTPRHTRPMLILVKGSGSRPRRARLCHVQAKAKVRATTTRGLTAWSWMPEKGRPNKICRITSGELASRLSRPDFSSKPSQNRMLKSVTTKMPNTLGCGLASPLSGLFTFRRLTFEPKGNLTRRAAVHQK